VCVCVCVCVWWMAGWLNWPQLAQLSQPATKHTDTHTHTLPQRLFSRFSHLFPEGSFWGTFLFLMSLSTELEELLCLELCLNRAGYFLSKDCSLLRNIEAH